MQANAVIAVTADGAGRSLRLRGEDYRGGSFQPMVSQARLQPGYYPGPRGLSPVNDPSKGGMSWGGQGHGCNDSSGWFVVDSVSYEGDAMTALQARFEMYCDGSPGPLHGAPTASNNVSSTSIPDADGAIARWPERLQSVRDRELGHRVTVGG